MDEDICAVDVGVRRLDVALIGLVTFVERVAGAPLVGQETAEQPDAFVTGGRGGQPLQRSQTQRLRARRRREALWIDGVGMLRTEQRVLDAIAALDESDRRAKQDRRAQLAQKKLIHGRWLRSRCSVGGGNTSRAARSENHSECPSARNSIPDRCRSTS